MPPQINFSKKDILDAAFELIRQEGLEVLTARRIARELECSTHLIYRAFQSVKDLEEALLSGNRFSEKAVGRLTAYCLLPAVCCLLSVVYPRFLRMISIASLNP